MPKVLLTAAQKAADDDRRRAEQLRLEIGALMGATGMTRQELARRLGFRDYHALSSRLADPSTFRAGELWAIDRMYQKVFEGRRISA